jgi:hypothetical protein
MPKKVVCIAEGRGKRRPLRRMNANLLAELIAIHSQCPHQQKGMCALTIFTAPLAWEINKAMGCATEEDKGFRRYDPMCAARPLHPERFATMTLQEIADSIAEEPE